MDDLKEYEGFTVSMALVDALPVIFFSATIFMIALALKGSGITFWVCIIGAIMIIISGLCKVLWKLLLGLKVGDVKILNKIFVPFMAGGFLITVVGVIIGTITKAIKWGAVIHAMTSLPAIIFFIFGIFALCAMGVLRSSKKREDFNKDAKKNWIAQFTNAFAQGMVMLGTLFALKG